MDLVAVLMARLVRAEPLPFLGRTGTWSYPGLVEDLGIGVLDENTPVQVGDDLDIWSRRLPVRSWRYRYERLLPGDAVNPVKIGVIGVDQRLSTLLHERNDQCIPKVEMAGRAK
jgi:hypothetical protein